MSKLTTRKEVIERYWPDYLDFCMKNKKYVASIGEHIVAPTTPTINNFWHWYITDGPMGVKHACRYYNKEVIKYV